MNKKSILSFDTVMWIPKLMLLVSSAVLVYFVVYLLIVNDVGTEHLRAHVFTERIL